MAFKLNHVHLKTPDPQKTAQFYVDTLGAKIIGEAGTNASPKDRSVVFQAYFERLLSSYKAIPDFIGYARLIEDTNRALMRRRDDRFGRSSRCGLRTPRRDG